ncbi:YsnF/AvaK domain-containing protein [Massilia sp. TSP1-1-2]|uniref:YsnF/AvaK domain-containing protein n=1 Tax=Massilia sp. TSP1-1-2 TaxID=2804649 RepID=UPI003CEF19FF
MQHTLIAVFDNRSDAQTALEDLVASGFSRSVARLSEGDPTGQTSLESGSAHGSSASAGAATKDNSIGASIKNFFGDIFGADRSTDAQMYSDAVNRGHYVLTLTADSEPEVERAADIVERYGPVDIDEHAQQWGAGATGGQDSMRMGAGAMQQASGMAQQASAQSGMQSGMQSDMQAGQRPLQGSGIQGTQYQDSQQRAADTTAIPVIQEELKVGKREVQRGGVRVYQRVVETPVNETVGLREEHVNVERHAVDRPVSAADVNAFQETTIELRESAEEAVVEKTARVVEEVVVGKEVSQRQQNISDTVRRTEVEIEQLTPHDDAYFRGHWNSMYARSGGAYEDYAPAYSYGSSMANNEKYRGRPWNDVEGSLRSDWETRNPGSTWENMKAAVRHGWERITS